MNQNNDTKNIQNNKQKDTQSSSITSLQDSLSQISLSGQIENICGNDNQNSIVNSNSSTWIAPVVADPDDFVMRKILSALSKLTIDNFDRIVPILHSLYGDFASEEMFKKAVTTLHDKALCEPAFSS